MQKRTTPIHFADTRGAAMRVVSPNGLKLRPLVRPGGRHSPAPAALQTSLRDEDDEQIAAIKSDVVLLQSKIDELRPRLKIGAHPPTAISVDMQQLELDLLAINPPCDDELRKKQAQLILYEMVLQKSSELAKLLHSSHQARPEAPLTPPPELFSPGRIVAPPAAPTVSQFPASPIPAYPSMTAVTGEFLTGLFRMADQIGVSLGDVKIRVPEDKCSVCQAPTSANSSLFGASFGPGTVPCPASVKSMASSAAPETRDPLREPTPIESQAQNKSTGGKPDPKAKPPAKGGPPAPPDPHADCKTQIAQLEEDKEAFKEAYLKLQNFVKDTSTSGPMRVGLNALDAQLLERLGVPWEDGCLKVPEEEPEPAIMAVFNATLQSVRSEQSLKQADLKKKGLPLPKAAEEPPPEDNSLKSKALPLVIGAQRLVMRKLQDRIFELQQESALKEQGYAKFMDEKGKQLEALQYKFEMQALRFEKQIAGLQEEVEEANARCQKTEELMQQGKQVRIQKQPIVQTKQDTFMGPEAEREYKEALKKKDCYISLLEQQLTDNGQAAAQHETSIEQVRMEAQEHLRQCHMLEGRIHDQTRYMKEKSLEVVRHKQQAEHEQALRLEHVRILAEHEITIRDLRHKVRELTEERRNLMEAAQRHEMEVDQIKKAAESTQQSLQRQLDKLSLDSREAEYRYKRLLAPLNASVDHFLGLVMHSSLGQDPGSPSRAPDPGSVAKLQKTFQHIREEFARWEKSREATIGSLARRPSTPPVGAQQADLESYASPGPGQGHRTSQGALHGQFSRSTSLDHRNSDFFLRGHSEAFGLPVLPDSHVSFLAGEWSP
mmetsp:Transcript_31731/g.56979  ORF Transcript_31731/g.56979 Transcript_31731/m.56979 type:complete len:832 (-) Transcript_31731:1626-4121(-)